VAFSRKVDRIVTLAFVPAVQTPTGQPAEGWWFIFHDDKLVVQVRETGAEVPFAADPATLGLAVEQPLYLGSLDGSPCQAASLAGKGLLPAGFVLEGLRTLFGRLSEEMFALAGRASQIVTWDRTHRFCGRCGTATEGLAGERARRCPTCGLTAYPRLSPCVIVLITRGDEVLLARGRHFPPGRYSTPAGFVEPGETLEETVSRELMEEVGVSVRQVRYFGSQPWPYPHQLMIGFTCEWAAGEITIDPAEIADAQWFTRQTMPEIPPPMSISRRLIDFYLAGGTGAKR
jgi:NAD+ diphosphatase